MSDSLADLHAALEQAIVDGLTQDPSMAAYRTWHYRDLPRMTPELMETFIGVVGEENMKWLTFADYGDSQRGQLLISPQGMANISEWSKAPN